MNFDIFYFSFIRIKIIKLNNNNFTQIDVQYLMLMSRFVDLSFNRLNSFPKQSFDEVDVKYFKLNDNFFEYLTDDILRKSDCVYISKLVLLDLSRNKIKNISETSLLDLFNLEYLKLSQNRLVKIENGTFINLIKLIDLDLSNNHLTKLDKSLLKNSRFLLKLNLSFNEFESFDNELFSNLKQLVSLDISNNSIKSISFLDVGLANLTVLNIRFNLITSFEERYGLDSMATLFISSDILNKFEYVMNLIKSFYKKIPVKSRQVSHQNDSVQYFKSVSIFYPKDLVNSSSFKADRDCFNSLYLIKYRIILNLKDGEELELFKSKCETYIHKLFVN